MKLVLLLLLPVLQAKRFGGKTKTDRQLVDQDSGLDWGDFDLGDWVDGFFNDDNDHDHDNDDDLLLDDHDDSWRNIGDGGFVDWTDLDWGSFDFDNFTWDDISWNSSGWDDFLSDIDFGNNDVDFCSILESSVGIGRAFGIEGNCTCNDDSNENVTDMDIGCSFKHQCFEASPLCTNVDLNYTMDASVISVGTCIDFENDTFPEICFSYSFDMTGQKSQTCDVKYDGNPCECEIQDFCLQLDCSMYLPGAAMDTCQILDTIGAEDVSTFLPDFPVFRAGYTPTFDTIHWQSLDWEHLDTENFKLLQIDWGHSAESHQFGDILNLESTISGGLLLPILEGFIGMSDEFGAAGGCNATIDQDGFSLDCSFQNVCASSELCSSVDLHFGFTSLGAVDADACFNFANDTHPETCIAYDIPVASIGSSPTCTAIYGDNGCKCSIDEDFCVSVDCSEYEPTAVESTCQDFSLSGSSAAAFVPRFSLPAQDDGTVMVDGFDTSGTDSENTGNDGIGIEEVNAASQVNQSLNSGGIAISSALTTTLLVSLPFLLCLF